MSRPYYSSEILETLHDGDRETEVVACVEARHDPATEKLHARLDAFLREVNQRGADPELRPSWLPSPQEAIEGVPAEEATAMARELFHHWVVKVREALRAKREGEI